jgi:alkanesulfonate monooxygenase SsuD/methylene tetrahydromethanopterin reductase-like flavin-dependent oxidoreductase (luciferase family)
MIFTGHTSTVMRTSASCRSIFSAAGRTETEPGPRLGAAVLIVPYRHPLLIARMAANLNRLSGGRLVLGVGVGWARQEFAALRRLPRRADSDPGRRQQ